MGASKSDNNVSPEVSPPEPNKSLAFAYLCGILGCMTSVLLGYDIGVMSGAGIYIQRDLKLNHVELEVLNGIINLYSLVGSALAGKTSDLIGRKKTIILAAVIFFIGAILMGLAPSYAVLMLGRFVAGVGIGYALMIAPVYTTELAPASARGFLTSFPEVFVNLGILLGYVANLCFSGLSLKVGWRLMLGIGAIPSVVIIFGVLAMPESPRWLVMQGRLGEARRILIKTTGSKQEADSRINDIKEAAGIPLDCNDEIVQVPKVDKKHAVWKDLFLHPTPAVRRILIAVCGIHMFQQTSGIDAVVIYSPTIFRKAGIQTDRKLLQATVAVGTVKTLCILIATFFLDKVGRRALFLSSLAGMIVTVSLLATSLTVIQNHPNETIQWAIALAIAMVLAYVAAFSVGLGPGTWVYGSEILPLRLRAQGTGLAVAVNRSFSGLISMTFLSLSNALTIGGSFFLFAGVATLAWIFVFTYLPETRGRNLEDIEVLFEKKGGNKSTANSTQS